jgi:hypothetical protein
MARAYVASGLLSNTCSNLLGDPAAGEEALVADDGRPGARRPTREDGYAPLRDYAGLGDGRSVALVALDGSVDWWALPDVDSTPAFGALLDAAEGGCIELAPTDPFTVDRRYVGATNVVETVFTTDGGRVRVTDALNTGVAGRLPWSELARRVEGLAGTVPMAWRIAPGNGLGRLSPWTRDDDRGPLLKLDDVSLGVRSAGVGDPVVGPRDVRGAFEARGGVAASSASSPPRANRCTCPTPRPWTGASTGRSAAGRTGPTPSRGTGRSRRTSCAARWP